MRTSTDGPDESVTTGSKRDVLGVHIDAVTPEEAVGRVIAAAQEGRTYRVSALAVHGVMEGYDDPEHLWRLNHLEMVTPDGQPVRWALNLLHGAGLRERVYGPTLMLNVCAQAAREQLPIYLLGSTSDVLTELQRSLEDRFEGLEVAGTAPSTFRKVSETEMVEICGEVRASGAKITFVGLGCPRQEIFAFEAGPHLEMPVLAVGAAFEYHAGLRDEPPGWMQRWGLQWLHRLLDDPKRLWKRYATTNPRFLAGIARQRFSRAAHGKIRPEPPSFQGWA